MIGCNQIKDIAWDMSSKFMDRDCPPPNLSMLVSRVVLLVMMLAGEAGLLKDVDARDLVFSIICFIGDKKESRLLKLWGGLEV